MLDIIADFSNIEAPTNDFALIKKGLYEAFVDQASFKTPTDKDGNVKDERLAVMFKLDSGRTIWKEFYLFNSGANKVQARRIASEQLISLTDALGSTVKEGLTREKILSMLTVGGKIAIYVNVKFNKFFNEDKNEISSFNKIDGKSVQSDDLTPKVDSSDIPF